MNLDFSYLYIPKCVIPNLPTQRIKLPMWYKYRATLYFCMSKTKKSEKSASGGQGLTDRGNWRFVSCSLNLSQQSEHKKFSTHVIQLVKIAISVKLFFGHQISSVCQTRPNWTDSPVCMNLSESTLELDYKFSEKYSFDRAMEVTFPILTRKTR